MMIFPTPHTPYPTPRLLFSFLVTPSGSAPLIPAVVDEALLGCDRVFDAYCLLLKKNLGDCLCGQDFSCLRSRL